ncbi:hypothetical protein [Cerasicoccus maritimus]|uniref:hypothetical protein n=1 Tax=Cerasicoccus maritimus TaxID=490089 RepID=UPI002852B64A|nr:hypothetical protein [Cerasicoccus maritimus]
MSERKIEPRYGCEAYVGRNGHVCIRQERDYDGESVIVLHHEEALELIDLLKDVYQEALDFVPEPDDE